MAQLTGEQLGEGRLDLVPMIDCIMLLLLFFMMTSRFTPEEKIVQNILPTHGGGPGRPVETPPQFIYLNIYPAGLSAATQSEREYQQQFDALTKHGAEPLIPVAEFRVSKRDKAVRLSVQDLAQRDPAAVAAPVAMIHQFVKDELTALEQPGRDRNRQRPVIIQCFSSLSWQYALIAFDAVRAYEMDKQPELRMLAPKDAQGKAREFHFSAPRLRNFKANELGSELYEILHSR